MNPIIIDEKTGEPISETGCTKLYKLKLIIWIIKNL